MTFTNRDSAVDAAIRQAGGYVHALDGVRGVAALAVVLYHVEYFHHWFAKGYLAVDLFFILSGYVLSHRYGQQAATGGSLGKFVWARVARLYPLHLATLLLLALAEFVLWHGLHKHAVIAGDLGYTFVLNFFLIQCVGLLDAPSWNTSSWSISVEFWVNIAWFWLLGRIKGFHARIGLMLAMWLGGLSVLAMHSSVIDHHMQSMLAVSAGIWRCMAGFACGALIFYFRDSLCRYGGVALIMAAVLSLLILATAPAYADYVVVGLVFPCIVIASLGKKEASRFVALLSWRPIAWLGLVSYSVYLNHLLVIKAVNLVGAKLDPLLRGVAIVAIVLVLSALTYRFVEAPARKFLLSKWQTRGRQPVDAAA